ncbi:MAG: DUF4340 domain-containing protein [Spirochaetia bacterium]|nr:DUF4340 domain-containing protein [Spirochaetia bacterium]
MKYKTKIISLSAVIVILAATYLMGGLFTAQKAVEKKAMEPLFDLALKDTLTSVRVSTTPEAGIVTIEKAGNDWVIRIDENVTYPASKIRVNSLITSVFDVTKFKLMGRGEKYWSEFELEPDRADTVEILKDGQSMFTLYVGKEGPGGKGDYVRSSLTNEIYLTDATMQRHFGQDPRYWFNMRLFPEGYTGEDIFAFTFIDMNSDAKISLKREAQGKLGKWINLVPDAPEPNGKVADAIADNLALLEAVNFVNGADIIPNVVVELDTGKLGHMTIDCQKIEDEGQYVYLLKKRGDSYMYLIQEDKLKRLFQPEGLFPAPSKTE